MGINLVDVLAKVTLLNKIVPVVEGIVSELTPTIAVAGADVSQIVADINKLLADLKDKGYSLQEVVEAALKGSSTTAPPAA